MTKLANSSLKDMTSNVATTINMQSNNKNKHQHIILSNDVKASIQSNTYPSKNEISIIGLLDHQPTNITLQNNNLANNQSDERSQRDNLIQSSKDNNTPSKYSRSNKDEDEEEDMDEEEREEGDDKKEETIDHEETIDYETPGINNVPTNTKTKDNLDNNTVYDNTIGDNSKTIAVNKTVADNSTATDNPGNSTNNVAPGENKTGSFLL